MEQTAKDIKDTPEYHTAQKFLQSKEFEYLTKGENAKFSGTDTNSANDLRNIRDYIYDQIAPSSRKLTFNDYRSADITCFQIGQALNARDDYMAQQKQASEKTYRHKTPTVTKNSYARLGRYPVGTRLRA